MAGIEQASKKRKKSEQPEEPPKPVGPSWAANIPDMVFARIGGKPLGYQKHFLFPMWDNKYRFNVLVREPVKKVPGKPDSADEREAFKSWWLVFTPTGELVESFPPLPGSVTPTQVNDLVEG